MASHTKKPYLRAGCPYLYFMNGSKHGKSKLSFQGPDLGSMFLLLTKTSRANGIHYESTSPINLT